jgi:LL-diaminopimelate aminotransferase
LPSPSTRLSQIPPYLFGQIAALKAKAIAEGRDLVDLGIGDPDQPTPEAIVEALYSAAKNPETHRYDESPLGEAGFIEAVTRWFGSRFGVEIDPRSEALMLIGSKEGLAHLAWTYIDAGDVSLAPDPAYTVYRVNTLMAGGEVCPMPLLRERGFVPDLTQIPSDAARRAKLMWLNYPNNPTGATATLEFFREAVDFCRQYDIVLVNDAAYSEVTFDGYRAPSVLQVEGAKDLAVEFHSFSKMFNMTGWRMGVALGCKDVISALNKMKSNIDSKQFPAVSRAAAYAIENVSNGAFLDVIRERRDVLVDGLASLGWDVQRPKATFYVWAPIPGGGSSIEFASRLLEEAGVLAIPGVGYGAYGEGFIRMSLTVMGDQHGDRAREAVRRIQAAGIGARV